MLPRRTVFILGAGASCDLGLPSGDELRERILEVLQAERDTNRFSNKYIHISVAQRSESQGGSNWPQWLDAYHRAAARIRAGLPLAVSIDNYLDAHRSDRVMRELGKLAITVSILDAERNSVLKRGDAPPIVGIDCFQPSRQLEESWYLRLMRLLTSGVSVDSVSTLFENVAFVVFNYDRCLEQFLINAVMAYFNVPPHLAIESVKRLRIVHPYGRVGYLPWQEQPLTAAFGDCGVDLSLIARGIQTFTESADRGVVKEVRELVAGAETLIFMGYGFLDQNNELLSVNTANARRVFATTRGISDSDVTIVEREICNIIAKDKVIRPEEENSESHSQIFIERGFCRDLMDNHRFRLARNPEPLLRLS